MDRPATAALPAVTGSHRAACSSATSRARAGAAIQAWRVSDAARCVRAGYVSTAVSSPGRPRCASQVDDDEFTIGVGESPLRHGNIWIQPVR